MKINSRWGHQAKRDAGLLGLLLSIACIAQADASTAEYKITFAATWSSESHPTDFPSRPHFSNLTGTMHNDRVSFWQKGEIASDGIESMAETGSSTLLRQEFDAAVNAGSASAIISGGNIGRSPGITAMTLDTDSRFPKLTLVSMLAPSPDWFVGVSGLSLMENGAWRDRFSVDLFPYDAGTDSGPMFMSPNDDTIPRDPISLLTGYPFAFTPPVGTFSFELLSTTQIRGDVNSDTLINRSDLVVLTEHFGLASGAQENDGDINGDGAVSLLDLAEISMLLSETAFSDAAQSPTSVTAPEPTGAGALAIGAVVLLASWRRSRGIPGRWSMVSHPLH